MIQFKKIILHNFGSYGHAEIDLQNRGFCLISGQNNCSKDNAISNGSGKSMAFNAICYALTGETISGVKTNLKNINIDEPDCYVQIEFLYQKDLYNICRIVAPKSDLKIIRNDINLSGKGIRESEKKLQELLPELTKDFIASTLLLGQGMPHKFSSFSPSGRKDLLEKLTKSDFMIDDLKSRIANRLQELSSKIREYEDSLLTNRTQLNGYANQLEKLRLGQQNKEQPNFDILLNEQQAKLAKLASSLTAIQEYIMSSETQLEHLNNKLVEITNEKTKIVNEEFEAYNSAYTELNSQKVKLEVEIASIRKEITKIKSIVDVCPTCGQHIPNVHKPDTCDMEAMVKSHEVNLSTIVQDISKCNKQHQEYQQQINAAFESELSSINAAIVETKSYIQKNRLDQQACQVNIEQARAIYNKLVYDKQNWEDFAKKQQKEIEKLEEEVARITNIISITSLAKDDFDQRLAVVKKMDQLTKRDFRGYLLINIISYVNQKAKQYCETVFGTRELSLEINGNALDITYCHKAFDSLSGGEKQRVDLILQLAIRDLLNSYLNLSANILVLDEITDFLDKKSCAAVMKLLEKELNTVESVFIISHHTTDLEIPVDSEIKIIKNENGISEIY